MVSSSASSTLQKNSIFFKNWNLLNALHYYVASLLSKSIHFFKKSLTDPKLFMHKDLLAFIFLIIMSFEWPAFAVYVTHGLPNSLKEQDNAVFQ